MPANGTAYADAGEAWGTLVKDMEFEKAGLEILPGYLTCWESAYWNKANVVRLNADEDLAIHANFTANKNGAVDLAKVGAGTLVLDGTNSCVGTLDVEEGTLCVTGGATKAGLFKSDPHPYEGRYPCGSLVHNGVWYYGTYCLNPLGKRKGNEDGYPWVWLGPFVGFRWSTDFGKTWNETPCTPGKPLFGENGLHGEPVKIGVPCFVDFGRNMEHSPDGKAYLVVQGSSDGKNLRYAYNSWINSDQTYLIRVTPSIANMNDASKYEFFAGRGADGQAQWTRDFAKMKPLLEWRDRMGRVSATYNPALRKYFMCVTDGRTTISKYNTYILEADELVGPWRLVTYMRDFGEQAYFVNIPSKFIDGRDGQTMWLCYASNWWRRKDANLKSIPSGSRYGMCLQEFRLIALGGHSK